MKKNLIYIVAAAICAAILTACAENTTDQQTTDRQSAEQTNAANTVNEISDKVSDNISIDIVKDIPTTQYFTDEEVPREDIENILLAGINSPSAMNKQPWHFSVVTDKTILEQIAGDMSIGMPANAKPPEDNENVPKPAKAGIADAPAVIIISADEGSEFDAGLACEAMAVQTNLMGYGTKIISSPNIALNGEKQAEYKELLSIPEDKISVAAILIGKEDTNADTTIDGYTGATERNPFDDTVSFIEAN